MASSLVENKFVLFSFVFVHLFSFLFVFVCFFSPSCLLTRSLSRLLLCAPHPFSFLHLSLSFTFLFPFLMSSTTASTTAAATTNVCRFPRFYFSIFPIFLCGLQVSCFALHLLV